MPFFTKAFLKTHYFKVRVGVGNTPSDSKIPGEGVPQGTVLKVTLFALAINGIFLVVPDDVLFTFVDDLSLSAAASQMSVAEHKL